MRAGVRGSRHIPYNAPIFRDLEPMEGRRRRSMTPLRAKFYCAGSQNGPNPVFPLFSVMSPRRGGSVPVPRQAGAMLNLLRHTRLTELGVADFLQRGREVCPILRTRHPPAFCTLHFSLCRTAAGSGRPLQDAVQWKRRPSLGRGSLRAACSSEGSMVIAGRAQVNLPRPIDG
jgi:hypothetical protein